jgi:Methyltransferase domain
VNKLITFANAYDKTGIHSIKLRNLLELRAVENEVKQIKTMFPPIEIGSITLVDQITLLSLIELVNPEKILEIGTYQGYSTRLFVENSDAKEIMTIDLPPLVSMMGSEVDHEKVLQEGDYNDEYLRSVQNQTGAKYLNGVNSVDFDRVRLIKSDSTKLNFNECVGPIQFAFIDGGHSYDIVKQDTNNVINQIKSGIVVWHDYSSTIHSDVTKFLGEYSSSNQIFYVQGGLCAFQIIG